MIRIVIATGIFPPDPGGPSYYAESLARSLGQISNVNVVPFSHERKLPLGIRHAVYFVRIAWALFRADAVIALDTFTVGVPAVLAAKLTGKKSIVRTGGDFLWEQYIERTKDPILLSEFYTKKLRLSFKENIIHWVTGITLRATDYVVFSTVWQQKIFTSAYKLSSTRTGVIENSYPPKSESEEPKKKNFLWAGRHIFLKNKQMLIEAFSEARKRRPDISLEILEVVSREELYNNLKSCYALLLPSISEISPNILMEAVSFGKPFISTKDIGLVGPILDCGLLVDTRNKSEFTDAILLFAEDSVYEQYKKKIQEFKFVRSYDDVSRDFMKVIMKL